MSESKHTPREWKCCQKENSEWWMVYWTYDGPDQEPCFGLIADNLFERDAILMTAAPRMLRALEWAIQHVENVLVLADRHDPEREMLKQARALIAVVRGEK